MSLVAGNMNFDCDEGSQLELDGYQFSTQINVVGAVKP